MVMVRALQRCFVGNALREAGDEFDHQGPISENVMVALEDLKPVEIPKPSKAVKASKKKAGEVQGLPNAVLPDPPAADIPTDS